VLRRPGVLPYGALLVGVIGLQAIDRQ